MGSRDERVRHKGLENTLGLDELMNYATIHEILVQQKDKNKINLEMAAVKQEVASKPQTDRVFRNSEPPRKRTYYS